MDDFYDILAELEALFASLGQPLPPLADDLGPEWLLPVLASSE